MREGRIWTDYLRVSLGRLAGIVVGIAVGGFPAAWKRRTPPPLPDTGFIWWAREVSNL
ncbi:protein of unknown function [Candidatus Hydrogenisulfobacillus filiaventi]|uniref:Uncharacterized protein n=1 Tax=Candidatus Hydrogenisulfobacillus filiaventi TaxID=2707344 RepID=A0A6F8ZIA6_9FIRM|nr:protein of unknown function [Candidatus Hydrogenisulfobacillus filiaventi]